MNSLLYFIFTLILFSDIFRLYFYDNLSERILNDGSEFEQDQITHLYLLNLFDYSGITIAQLDNEYKRIKKSGSIILSINKFGLIMRLLTKIIEDEKR